MIHAAKQSSLASRMLLRISLLIALAVICMTVFAYLITVAQFRERMLDSLHQVVKIRSAYDSVHFEHAQENTTRLRDEYLLRLKRMGQDDPVREFEQWFVRYPDGLVRVRPELDNHHLLPSLYLRPSVPITPTLRRQVWVAFELLRQWGPALTQRYYSAYIDLPAIGLIMYSPSVNWGALADKTTNNYDYPPVRNSAPDRNPLRQTLWSEVYFDDKAGIWMVSAVTPADLDGKWIASVSQDVSIDALTARTLNDSLPSSYNLIVSQDGNLLAHPSLMDRIRQSNGVLKIDALQDPLLSDIAERVKDAGMLPTVTTSSSGDYLLGFARIRGPNWHFITVMPQSVITSLALANARAVLLIGVTVLALTLVLLSVLIRHQIAVPLRRLIRVTDAMQAGRLDVRVGVIGGGELAELAQRFDRMAERIEERDQQLYRIAHHDELTGLPNRLQLQEILAGKLAQCQTHFTRLAVIFVDLDRFKVINDSRGHSVGDAVLCQVSHIIKQCIRDQDFVARLGGDEFIILLEDKRDARPAALQTMGRLLKALERPLQVDDMELHTSPSIGIALYPEDGQDAETLIRRADVAMYRAKQEGRNQAIFFDAGMERDSTRMVELEGALRRAFANEEFLLHYQPKVRLDDQTLVGFEALVRWQRPGSGLMPPADFLPVLQELGLMTHLNDYVQEKTCQQLAQWQQAGYQLVPVSLNLTAETMRAPSLISSFSARCQHWGVAPSLLEIEITEGALLDETAAVQHNLRGLRELGVSIAIDDFGTGYSALSYLQRFQMDCIKIDRSFVSVLGAREGDSPMIRAISLIGEHLGMTVIAEGVETEQQLASLRALGCQLGQGYFFGRPMPAAEAAERMTMQATQMTPE